MTHHIEISIPAVFPLAIANINENGIRKAAMLGVTLQHPPIQFKAAKQKKMTIYGPRADHVRKCAEAYAKKNGLTQAVEIIIDHTSPSMVGVGSDSMLALGAAQAVAWANGLDFEDVDALAEDMNISQSDPLAYWAYKKGGFLLVELNQAAGVVPTLLRHHTIQHRANVAWVFLYHFPKIPQGTAESVEADRLAALKTAVSDLPTETGELIVDALWPALLKDEFEPFSEALMALRQINESVLKSHESWLAPTENTLKALDVFEKGKAAAWGESYTGISAFGLLKGGAASQEVRAKLLHEIGYFGGQFVASIADNVGARFTLRKEGFH